MRALSFIFIVASLTFGCSSKEKPQGVNILTHRGTDTLSNFYYDGHKDFDFYGKNGLDSIITNKIYHDRFPWTFALGIKDRVNFQNRLGAFAHIPADYMADVKSMHSEFLYAEYKIEADYETIVIENYVDSTDIVKVKYETYAAVDSESYDTILFQEMAYFLKEDQIVAHFYVYDNNATRELLSDLFDDSITKIKRYSK